MTAGRLLRTLASVIAPPLLALGGCAITDGSGASVGEARGALYEKLDATQTALGGEWENRDDPTARGCVIPIAVKGELYPGLRIGPAPRNPSDAIEAVVDVWTGWGYTVDTTVVGDVTELQGHSPVDELLVLKVSAEAMTLQGESECRPAG